MKFKKNKPTRNGRDTTEVSIQVPKTEKKNLETSITKEN